MSTTKDKKYRVIIIVEALLLALTFHLLLLFVFSVPAAENSLYQSSYKHISMLPLHRRADKSLKSINTWMDYADPTLISKPDERFGYGTLTGEHGLRESIRDLEPSASGRAVTFNEVQVPDILSGTAALPSEPAVLPHFMVRNPRVSVPEVLSPRAVTEDGRFIAQLPVLSGGIPENPSVLFFETQGEDMLPRYRILRSCGVTALDHKALKACLLSERLGSFLGADKTLTVRVYWDAGRKGAGEVKGAGK